MDFKPMIDSLLKKRKKVTNEDMAPSGLSGVKKLNMLPILIVGTVVLFFIIIVALAASQRGQRNVRVEEYKSYNTENRARSIVKDLPSGVVTPKVSLDTPPLPGKEYRESTQNKTQVIIDPNIETIRRERAALAMHAAKAKSNVSINDLNRAYQNVTQNKTELSTNRQNMSTNEMLARIDQAIDSAGDMTEAHEAYQRLLNQTKGTQ